MRILNLSLDRKVLEKDSTVKRRLVALTGRHGTDAEPRKIALLSRGRQERGTETEEVEITMLVPADRDVKEEISPHLTVHGVGGGKMVQLWKMWRKGESLIRNPLSLIPTTPNPSLEKEGRKRYDFITTQDTAYLALLAYLLARRFRVPLEIQVHGLEKFTGFRKRVAAFVLHRADKIRVVSERLKKQLTTNYQLPTTKLYVLPIYTQIEIPHRASKQKAVPYPFTFLSVGRLVPVKNVSLQIRALAKVAEEIPQVRLRIVGDGAERRNLQLTTYNLQLGDKVIFEGEQKEVDRFYEEANAFLLTSNSEGWGLVVLEAAAHRLPIIMTDVGLAREVIKNGESGFIIPVGDEEELALAMKELIDKPELRARLGEGAYRAFLALPGREEQIQKQVKTWQALLNRGTVN